MARVQDMSSRFVLDLAFCVGDEVPETHFGKILNKFTALGLKYFGLFLLAIGLAPVAEPIGEQ